MSQLRLRCKKNFLEVNQGQDQKLGIRVVIPILCIKQDGTRSFIKIMLYKVYLLFKTSFFIFSPIFGMNAGCLKGIQGAMFENFWFVT